MARLSVIMPSYNCGKYIGEAIDSVLKQSFVDLEIIVVDGGSADSTDEVMAKYGKDRRVIYQKMPGYGISKARNHGIKISGGELIAFLDADDLFMDGKIERQISEFDNDKRVEISYTNTIYFNHETGKEALSSYYNFSGDIFYYLKRSNFVHPSCVMARRSVFKNTLFDENIPSHEDWDIFLRLSRDGVLFNYIKEPFSKIRVRPNSTTTNINAMNESRHLVGVKAKEYWQEFKLKMNIFTVPGLKAVSRYAYFKINSFLIGFPGRDCFNRPVPNDIVC